MSSETAVLLDKASEARRGQYVVAGSSAQRGPCPIVNSLANHGYIPRDGRKVHPDELKAALREIGLSNVLSSILVGPVFLEYKDPSYPDPQQQRSFFGKLWYLVRNPWALFAARFGLRAPGQKDAKGKYLNLNELARQGVIEHDVSLSRHDYAQGDSVHKQMALIDEMLSSSSDGGQHLTMEDLAEFRKRRIKTQTKDNPDLTYGSKEHRAGCAETVLLLQLVGDGKKARCDYVRALFKEERLPYSEGWDPRRWWTIGLLAVVKGTKQINGMIGLKY